MQQSPAPKDITASSIPDPGFLAATAPILILAATPAQPPTLATSITSSVELVWLPPATAILVATARSYLLLLLLANQHRELTCDLLLPHCS